jgi:hypothetical protein
MSEFYRFGEQGQIETVNTVILKTARVDSQTPTGQISINAQNSGWIAMTADGRMFDEYNHEWSLVPKDLIIDLRLVIANTNVAIPKIEAFSRFIRLKRGDGKYVGAGAIIGESNRAMYVLALNKREGSIMTVDEIQRIEQLSYVSSIEYISFESIESNHLSVDLPFGMIVLPRRSLDNYFFQYKDGAIRIGSGHQLFGQIVGMTMANNGNCLALYYDQATNRCLAEVDNIFAMKMSTIAQGFPVGIFVNPITGNIV